MAGYYGASEYVKTAFIVLAITGVFHIVSYGAPYWTTRSNAHASGHAGLWWGCSDGLCYERFNLWVEGRLVRVCYSLKSYRTVHIYKKYNQNMDITNHCFITSIESFELNSYQYSR